MDNMAIYMALALTPLVLSILTAYCILVNYRRGSQLSIHACPTCRRELLVTEGKPGSGTLMSNLVRACNAQSQPGNGAINQHTASIREADESKQLTVDEILGNIFVFNFAGHDTTAITLAYSLLLFVARPDVQEWIAEELNLYLHSEDSEIWIYEAALPKLKRCLAVLVHARP